MKKPLLALALIFCLTASLAILTSCGGEADDGGNEGCAHIWDTEATVDTAATCKKEGLSSVKCTLCGEKMPDSDTVIPKAEHNYVINNYFAPTCVAAGFEAKTCRVCGYHVESFPPATGIHTWAEAPTETREPTCNTDGYQAILCTRCAEATKPGSVEVIPATHVWDNIATVDVEPTYTEPGVRSIKCMHCTAKKPGSEEIIPALGNTN